MAFKFKPICQVHGHSDYSLDGASSVKSLNKRFKELGIKYAALTEHGNLNSAIEHYTTAKECGVSPVVGIEAYLLDKWSPQDFYKSGPKKDQAKPQYVHLTIHFKNENAYRYFCQLTPKMEERAIVRFGERKPILLWEELEPIRNDISVCSSCFVGIVMKHLLRGDTDMARKTYQELRSLVPKGSFFVEVFPHAVDHDWKRPEIDYKTKQIIKPGRFEKRECTPFAPDGDMQKSMNKFLIQLAKENKDPILPSLDFHFAYPEDKVVQDGKLGNGMELFQFHNTYDVMDQDKAAQHFIDTLGVSAKEVEEWIDNSYMWGEQFKDFKLTTNKDRWALPELDKESLQYVGEIIKKNGRMDWTNPEQIARLREEINVLSKNGKIDVIPYFRPLVEISEWAKAEGVLTNLRGSAGGSFLVYLMGISGINPLKHDLSFERFINAGRIKANTLPDLDLDAGERDRLIGFLKDKYGERIMQLSVDVKSKIKSCIKDAERAVLGSVRQQTEDLCKLIPNPDQGMDEYEYVFGGTSKDGQVTIGVIDTIPQLKKYAEDNAEIWTMVTKSLGITRNKGKHACSFVITPEPVSSYVPLMTVGSEIITGYSPKSIELAGLVKYDFLGVNTLKDIGLCLKLIKQRTGEQLDIYSLPDDDYVYEQFRLGNNETVFQYNTPTVKPALAAIKPKSRDKLADITALERPGCLDADYGDGRTLEEVYISRSNGEKIEYVHPDLEPIFKETNGIALFQEQTIKVFRDLAGYTAEEAEIVRRGIGKKDAKLLKESTDRLKTKCLERGWTENQVQLLVDQIMASARYSFNKSHACSYSYVGYACQYLKTKYPLEWWCSVLNNADKTELPKFWTYCGHLVLMPDVNLSGEGFTIEGTRIRAPINIANGIGEAAYKLITANKPYTDLKSFVEKTKKAGRAVHKGVVIKMIASGLIDSLFEPGLGIEDKLYKYFEIKKELEGEKKIEEIPPEYIGVNSLRQYKLKKEIVNVYSEDLRDLFFKSRGLTPPQRKDSRWLYNNQRFVAGQHLEPITLEMIQNEAMRQEFDGNICTVSYVVDESTRSYQGKSKQMTRLLIDTNGVFRETIIWPDYGGSVAQTGFQDCIVKITWKLNPKRGELAVRKIEKVL